MVNQFRRAAEAVDDINDELKNNVRNTFVRSVESTADEMKRYIRVKDAIASRTLLNSIMAVPNPPESKAFASMQIVGAPHWKYVEYGTGRYTGRNYSAPDVAAPFDVIEQWVEDKGIVPDPDGPYETQRELAEAIAFSLSTGTPQQKFARPAIRGPRGRSGIARRIKQAMADTFARHL